MQIRLLLIPVALMLGAILPIQAAINTRLAKAVGGAVQSAFVSFAVGTIALFLYLLFTGKFSMQGIEPRQSPWWIWTGGLLGCFFVAGIVVVMPKLGSVLAFSLVIAGQMLVAILVDQYGWLGTAVREVTPGRIAGVVLLVIAVYLIRKY